MSMYGGNTIIIDDNSIMVYISQLRNKIRR